MTKIITIKPLGKTLQDAGLITASQIEVALYDQQYNPPSYPILQIGLDCEVAALDRRISQRTYKMIELGLVAEVKFLCQKYGENLPLLDTLGYGEIKQYLKGQLDLDEAIALIITHTRQFAKRQRTWFRNNSEIEWFTNDSPDLLDKVMQRIEEFF